MQLSRKRCWRGRISNNYPSSGAGNKTIPIFSILRMISILVIDTNVKALSEHGLKRVIDLPHRNTPMEMQCHGSTFWYLYHWLRKPFMRHKWPPISSVMGSEEGLWEWLETYGAFPQGTIRRLAVLLVDDLLLWKHSKWHNDVDLAFTGFKGLCCARKASLSLIHHFRWTVWAISFLATVMESLEATAFLEILHQTFLVLLSSFRCWSKTMLWLPFVNSQRRNRALIKFIWK